MSMVISCHQSDLGLILRLCSNLKGVCLNSPLMRVIVLWYLSFLLCSYPFTCFPVHHVVLKEVLVGSILVLEIDVVTHHLLRFFKIELSRVTES